MDRNNEVRGMLESEIRRIWENSGRSLVPLRDEDQLFQLGLDSLDLAQLIVAMEQRLGVDPFRRQTVPIRTFGNLISAYCAELVKSP